MELELFVLIIPKEKQSMRVKKIGNYITTYQPKQLTEWQKEVKEQLRRQIPRDFELLDGEIVIEELSFQFPPLKNWSKKKLRQLSNGDKIYKNTKPDLDNLEKNVFDCCNGIIWTDDARIVRINNVEKIYSGIPQIHIRVRNREAE